MEPKLKPYRKVNLLKAQSRYSSIYSSEEELCGKLGTVPAIRRVLNALGCGQCSQSIGAFWPNLKPAATRLDHVDVLSREAFLDVMSVDGFELADENGVPVVTGSYKEFYPLGKWKHENRRVPFAAFTDCDTQRNIAIALGGSLVLGLMASVAAGFLMTPAATVFGVMATIKGVLITAAAAGAYTTAVLQTTSPAASFIVQACIKYLLSDSGAAASLYMKDGEVFIMCDPTNETTLAAMATLALYGINVCDFNFNPIQAYYCAKLVDLSEEGMPVETKSLISDVKNYGEELYGKQ